MVGKTPTKTFKKYHGNSKHNRGGHCLTACPPLATEKKKHHRQRPLVGTPRYFPGRNCPRCASILDGKFLPPWNFRPRVPGAWNFWKNIPCFQVPGPLVTKVWERYTKNVHITIQPKTGTTTPIHPPWPCSGWTSPPAKRVATTFYFYGMASCRVFLVARQYPLLRLDITIILPFTLLNCCTLHILYILEKDPPTLDLKKEAKKARAIWLFGE